QFYETDAFLIEALARLVGAGLGGGEAVVIIATDAHRRQLDERLGACGMDLNVARAAGRYVVLDAAHTLDQLLVGDRVDAGRFVQVVGETIDQAAAAAPRVRAFGEMV